MFENYPKEIREKIKSLPTIPLDARAKNRRGKKQGQITFIKPAERIGGKIFWWVICQCGNIEKVRADSVRQFCAECGKIQKQQKLKGKGMKDLTGQKFNRLTALYPLPERRKNKIYWHCKCECGNECDVDAASLTTNNTKSCGCLKKENANFVKYKENLVGQHFGYLTVLEETPMRQYEKVVWKCKCDCGNIVYLNTGRLKGGNDTSCGCKKMSLGIIKIEEILKNNNITYKREYTEPSLQKKRCDFAIFQDNKVIRIIEFDGQQHFKTSGGWNNQKNLELTQKRDKEKNEWCLNHNIPLVRIPYWERDNITLEMLLGDQYLVTENSERYAQIN